MLLEDLHVQISSAHSWQFGIDEGLYFHYIFLYRHLSSTVRTTGCHACVLHGSEWITLLVAQVVQSTPVMTFHVLGMGTELPVRQAATSTIRKSKSQEFMM